MLPGNSTDKAADKISIYFFLNQLLKQNKELGLPVCQNQWEKMIHSKLESVASISMIYQRAKETRGRDLLVIHLECISWSCPKSLHPQYWG